MAINETLLWRRHASNVKTCLLLPVEKSLKHTSFRSNRNSTTIGEHLLWTKCSARAEVVSDAWGKAYGVWLLSIAGDLTKTSKAGGGKVLAISHCG